MKFNIKSYLSHSGWLLFERILRLTVGVCITALVARALGPSDFGRLSWAQSIVAMFAPLVGLGFDSLVAKWLIREVELSGQILFTAFISKLVAALLANAILVVAWFAGVHADMGLVVILGLTLVAQVSTLLDQYFQAHLAGKVCSLVQILALFVGGCVKLLLVLNGAGLIALAMAIVFEQFFGLMLFFLVYNRRREPERFAYGGSALLSRLLKESSPLIFSSVIGVVFLVVDQLMLRALVGPEALGVFAAAARITEAWYALLAVLASALYPAILHTEEGVDTVMGLCYEISIWVSVVIALLVSLASPLAINTLYGARFVGADTVLSIHIWTGVFVGLRLFSGKWMLSKGLTWLIFTRSLFGVIVNILLCLLLIPLYGAVGAAISTLLAFVFVGFVFDFMSSATRPQGILKLKAFLGKQLYNSLRY